MPEPVSLAEILEAFQRNVALSVHTSEPGMIVSYDSAKQTAHVQPVVKRCIVARDGSKTFETLPVLPNVPVQFPRGGGFAMSWPLSPGDFVQLHYSQKSISEWLGTGEISEPMDSRLHGLSGAVAVPGVVPSAQTLSEDAGALESLVLGRDGEEAQVRIKAGEIKLGASASDFVALASKVAAELATLRSTFNTHTHIGHAPANPTDPPLPLLAAFNSTAADLVKAK